METDLFSLHSEIERKHWWFVGRRQILNRVITKAIPVNERGLVLDVGCGTGANVVEFPGFVERLGIDQSEDAIKLARENSPAVKFIQGSVPEDIQDELASADLVTMNDVLEHVEDDQALFDSVWETLKPGANLLLTVPADPSLWSQHDVSFGHYRRYTAKTFLELWDGREVNIRLYSYFNSRLFPIVKLARMTGAASGLGNNQTDLFALPEVVNKLLVSLFAGEAKKLSRSIDACSDGFRHRLAYRRGVSLIALLQKPCPAEVGG